MPRRANKPVELKCDECEKEFVRNVPHKAVGGDEEDVVGWVLTEDSTRSVTCPQCGSGLLRVQR